MYLGDFAAGATVRGFFNTRKADGTPITLAGTPTLAVYKDGGTTESTAGVTLTVDFDSRTGLHLFAIDTSDAFYANGSDFSVVITQGTVDAISVVGAVVGRFSIVNRFADVVNVVGDVIGSVGSIDGVSFPANFGSLAINSSGHVSRVVLVDTSTAITNAVTVGAMNANTLTASALATDAVTEIRDSVFAYTVSQDDFFTVMGNLDSLQINLTNMLELDGAVYRWTANALEQAPSGGGSGDASQATLLLVKAKTDLITSGSISVLQDRVNDSTITMQYNESTSATVNLDEDTTSATLQFVVARPDGADVLTIANASITRTSSSFTVTITTAVTGTIGQYLWSLRDLSGGGNRVVTKGVLTVQNAAAIDA